MIDTCHVGEEDNAEIINILTFCAEEIKIDVAILKSLWGSLTEFETRSLEKFPWGTHW